MNILKLKQLKITSCLFIILSIVPNIAFSQNFFTQKSNNPSPNFNTLQSSPSYSNILPSKIEPTPINQNIKINSNTNICDNLNINRSTPNFLINLELNDLLMDYSKRSKELIPLSKNTYRSGFHLLGLFKGSVNYSLEPRYKVIQVSNSQYCGFLISATFNLKFNPIIYISKEVQQFQCSYNRVLAHEKQHYKFEYEVLRNSKQDILNTLNNGFPLVVSANSIDNIKKEYSEKTDLINKNINKSILAKTSSKHSSIDTDTNYELESKQCNVNENISLTQAMKNPY